PVSTFPPEKKCISLNLRTSLVNPSASINIKQHNPTDEPPPPPDVVALCVFTPIDGEARAYCCNVCSMLFIPDAPAPAALVVAVVPKLFNAAAFAGEDIPGALEICPACCAAA